MSPSARTISASPLKRCRASAAAHSAGVIAGPPATNSHMGWPTTSGATMAEQLEAARR